jgi:GT2 family glycosyltransferase
MQKNLMHLGKSMELSVIYVNWNSLDYLRESIASVYEFTHGTKFEVVVVDNDSPEGKLDTLHDSFPNITVIKSDRNLGFAGANNLGFEHSTGEYILLLNPDTRLIEPSIDIMMEQIQKLPGAGIVGCKLLNADLTVQLSSIQKFPNLVNQVIDAEYLRTRWPHSPLWGIAPLFEKNVMLLPVEVIPGACMLLRRTVFEQAGRYSEDYFMYAEDIDLNHKIAKLGLTNYYVGTTSIIHYGGRSSSKQRISHWATIMKYQAMVLYFRKTRGSLYEGLYRVAIAAAAAVRISLLTAMMPFGNILWDKEALNFSFHKWKAVLKWAFGFQDFSAENP